MSNLTLGFEFEHFKGFTMSYNQASQRVLIVVGDGKMTAGIEIFCGGAENARKIAFELRQVSAEFSDSVDEIAKAEVLKDING